VERLATIRVLLAVEIFIRLQSRIVRITELSRLLIGGGIALLRALAAAFILV
jgi:hypothetical protein